MGILSALLGENNPVAQFAGANHNWLSALGSGLASGPTFQQGLSSAVQMGPQGQRLDDAYATTQKAKADRLKAIQAASDALRSKGYGDVADAYANAGPAIDPSDAWNEVLKLSDPNYKLDAEYKKAQIAALTAKSDPTTTFDGTNMEGQAWNILLKAQSDPTLKNTPQYQTALSIVSQPKSQLVQGPDGNMVQVQQSPQLPAFLTPQPASPTVPTPAPFVPPAGSVGQDSGFSSALASPTTPKAQPVSSNGVTTTPVPGTGKANLTETQAKDVYFANNAEGAVPILDQIGTKLTSLGGNVASNAGTLGNYFKSSEYQQAEQAGRVFINSILRKDSGAAITKDENANYGETYLPRPGDKPEVIAQKAAARKRAVAGLKAGLPPQAILALEKTQKAEPSMSGTTTIDGVTIEPM